MTRAFQDFCEELVRGSDLELEIPFASGFIPDCRDQAVVIIDVFLNVVLLGDGLLGSRGSQRRLRSSESSLGLALSSISSGDNKGIKEARTECIDISMSGYITSTTRVPILQPSPAEIVVLLVDVKVNILHCFLNADGSSNSRDTSTNADDADWGWGVERTSFR